MKEWKRVERINKFIALKRIVNKGRVPHRDRD